MCWNSNSPQPLLACFLLVYIVFVSEPRAGFNRVSFETEVFGGRPVMCGSSRGSSSSSCSSRQRERGLGQSRNMTKYVYSKFHLGVVCVCRYFYCKMMCCPCLCFCSRPKECKLGFEFFDCSNNQLYGEVNMAVSNAHSCCCHRPLHTFAAIIVYG
jgi:hypothetical protein